MRERLFRGKRIDTGAWVHGACLAHDYDGHTIFNQNLGDGSLQGFEVIPETIGQYTGRDDKNGVKVVEGDVLIFDGDKFVISWNDETCGFRMDYWMFDEQYDLSEFWPTSEVIGNIHDNPELGR